MSEADFRSLTMALSGLGYEADRNVKYFLRELGSGRRLAAMAGDLVMSDLDVIVAASTGEAQAIQRLTTTIPIVMAFGLAPVELGLVKSLARPEGNVTGTTGAPIELAGKAVEVLRDTLPQLKHLAALVNGTRLGSLFEMETRRAGDALGIAVSVWKVQSTLELSRTFASLQRARPDAISVGHGLASSLRRIVQFANASRIPAMYASVPAVTAMGGLMAYAVNYSVLMKRTASIVDMVLHGSKPADIPIEQANRFVLAINRRAGNAIGVIFPPAVALRAEIIVE